jgi:hypothetical protein
MCRRNVGGHHCTDRHIGIACGGGRAFGGDRSQRGHRFESVPHYVEDNDTVVGAQKMGDHPRTHVTKSNEPDCAHGILQRQT